MEKNARLTFIEGERIELLPINPENVKVHARWVNDPKVRLYTRNVFPVSPEDLKKRLEQTQEPPKRDIFFEIYHKELDKIVGFVEFHYINYINHAADLGVLIGEKELWGNNLGTDAAKLMMKYGFEELNLVKITAIALRPNKGACRMIEKIRMKLELVMKNQAYFDGEYVDELKFCIFREEWEKTNK
jgi:RimJ/RimL family protein N-acetyltransferase